MDLIWDLLPWSIYLAGGLLSVVLGGAIVGGRLSRSWVAKAAPRLLIFGLMLLFLAPKPPPVAAAVLGYAGFAVLAAGWLLKGRVAAGVLAIGLVMVTAARFWIVWATKGADEALHLGLLMGAALVVTATVYFVAAWFERRAEARAGEGVDPPGAARP